MIAAPQRFELAPGYSICRVLNGGWQLASDHGSRALESRRALAHLVELAEAGFTTFDCADIYAGVEELLGDLSRRWRRRTQAPPLEVHTKYVPDRAKLGGLSGADIAAAVDRSLTRLGVERLDLLQLHWWDYEAPGCVETAVRLDGLRRAGKIRHLGVTNFDRRRLAAILDAGVEIVSHQVQYSLLDRRPENGMAAFCAERGIALLCYGALAGGFLSAAWLGSGEPPLGRESDRSLTKYHLIVREFGGWAAHQELLRTLDRIARRHRVSPASVAARWVLDRPGVAGVILGARSARHLEENRRLFAIELDQEDEARLSAVLAKHPGPAGDVYELERRPRGPHAAILRTDLRGD